MGLWGMRLAFGCVFVCIALVQAANITITPPLPLLQSLKYPKTALVCKEVASLRQAIPS